MALAEDMHGLRERVLADLSAAHNYYVDTKYAWSIVDQYIADGKEFEIRNTATSTVTTQADLAGKVQGYIAVHLAESSFQQLISLFESFFLDFLRLWLQAYPGSLGGKTVDFKTILEAPDKDAITALVVEKELIEILYKKPADWFEYLNSKVKLGCPTADEIARIAEAKASRDVLIHNRAIANRIYLSKAGACARCKEGERIEIPESYHQQTWELIRKVVEDITREALAKVS